MTRVWWLAFLLGLNPVFAAPAAQREEGPSYNAIGSGHFVRAVSDEGRYVTLEDGSRWEVDPRVRFYSNAWKPDEGIAVRRATPDEGFYYELDNTDQDDGVLANYLPH